MTTPTKQEFIEGPPPIPYDFSELCTECGTEAVLISHTRPVRNTEAEKEFGGSCLDWWEQWECGDPECGHIFVVSNGNY